jgi:tetratricopeptide (TPR) repeat protein
MKVHLSFWLAWLLPLGGMAQSLQLARNAHSPDTNVSQPAAVSLAERHVLPLFGEIGKTTAQIDEEIRFLSDCDRMFGSRDEASQFFVARGWEYLQEGQLDTATYRFNLAYLLNDKNMDAYWGLGVVCYQKDKLADAERMLRRGVDLAPDNVALLVDLSTVELKHYAVVNDPDDLNEADAVLQHAVRLDSTYAQSHYNLALIEYYRGQYEKAWEHLHNGRKLDFSLVNFEFIDQLRTKFPDPLGLFK